MDILVDFTPGTPDLFEAYFGLKEDLERILGRKVGRTWTPRPRRHAWKSFSMTS